MQVEGIFRDLGDNNLGLNNINRYIKKLSSIFVRHLRAVIAVLHPNTSNFLFEKKKTSAQSSIQSTWNGTRLKYIIKLGYN